jgi:hypothetical protein
MICRLFDRGSPPISGRAAMLFEHTAKLPYQGQAMAFTTS